jgi:hypothetical protein
MAEQLFEDHEYEEFPLPPTRTPPPFGTPEHDEYLKWLREICGPTQHGKRSDTIYKPEFAAQAKYAYNKGWTDEEVAGLFGVCRNTIRMWTLYYPEFAKARKLGKVLPDDEVEMAFYKRALGYDREVTKQQVTKDGKVIEYTEIVHYPPDAKAAMNWLKNRRPDAWRDRRELTGADGAPLNPAQPAKSKIELARRILYQLQRAGDEAGTQQLIPQLVEEKVTIHE